MITKCEAFNRNRDRVGILTYHWAANKKIRDELLPPEII
jgi:hypothetical protein